MLHTFRLRTFPEFEFLVGKHTRIMGQDSACWRKRQAASSDDAAADDSGAANRSPEKRQKTDAASEREQHGILVGVIGGLGPKASSQFYDEYIIHGRQLLFEAMSGADKDPHAALERVKRVSCSDWTLSEVRAVSAQSAGRTALIDQDHIPIMIYGNTQVPGRPAYILGKSDKDPTPQLAHTANSLVKGGANLLCMTCNTAHYFLPGIMRSLENGCDAKDMPRFLNMLLLTIRSIVRDSGKSNGTLKVGLLATRATIETGIYQNAAASAVEDDSVSLAVDIITPLSIAGTHGGQQESVEKAIFGDKGLKAGYTNVDIPEMRPFTQANVDLLMDQIALLKEAGADAVILGCTELPLVLSSDGEVLAGRTTGEDRARAARTTKLVNPSKVLADEVLRAALTSRNRHS